MDNWKCYVSRRNRNRQWLWRLLGLGNCTYESVRHSAGKYVKQQASTDGVESFWVVLKHGTFHHFSVKYLNRYVDEFSTGIRRLHGL